MIKAMRLATTLGAAVILNISTMASADVLCRGRVQAVVVDTQGNVNVNWGFDWINLCSIKYDTNRTSTVIMKESCTAWLSQAMTAMGMGKDFAAYYVGLNTCTGLRANDGFSVVQPSMVYILY